MDFILNIKDKPSFERMVHLLGTLTEEQQHSIENYIKGMNRAFWQVFALVKHRKMNQMIIRF